MSTRADGRAPSGAGPITLPIARAIDRAIVVDEP
jgi:hypothetical protein